MNRKHIQKLLRARKGKKDAVLQLGQQWAEEGLPATPAKKARTSDEEAGPPSSGRSRDLR